MSTKALEHHLKPLLPFLHKDGVTEICINRPFEVYLEQNSQFIRHEVPELSLEHLEAFAELVAEFNHQEISPERPLLSASLPGGERAQFVRSPACEKGKLVCAIRRHGMRDLTLDDYVQLGAFDPITQRTASPLSIVDKQLLDLHQQNDLKSFIALAVKARKNMVISGGTGTGKTTFLNACLKEIAPTERLITLEDTREVNVPQPNTVHLLVSKGQQGVANIDLLSLFEACLRLRPDRVLLSELRGKEVFAFLRAANSGHPGSLTTVHADTPQSCFEQLLFMMQQGGSSFNENMLLAYIKSIIPIVIQLKRSASPDRFMEVSEVYFDKAQNR